MLRTYYSDRLDNRQLGALMRMDDAVMNRRPECTVYGIGEADLGAVVNAYIIEHPESYFCALQFIRNAVTADSVRMQFLYNENCDEALFEEKLQAIYDKLDRVIDSYTSEYGVAKIVYDYFAANVKADQEVQNAFSRMSPNADSADWEAFAHEHGNAFSAYGAIVEKEAVCQGFSMAYRLVLTHYGLDVTCVLGKVGGCPHMLNAVTVGDRRVYVDITRGLVCDALPLVRYDMFLMPASRATYFVPDEDLGCDATDLHYFAREKLHFKDLFALRRYLNSYIYQATDGEIRFFYTGHGMNDDKLHDMAGEILAARCGNEYRMGNAIVDGGIGTFQMLKK